MEIIIYCSINELFRLRAGHWYTLHTRAPTSLDQACLRLLRQLCDLVSVEHPWLGHSLGRPFGSRVQGPHEVLAPPNSIRCALRPQ